jgi:hypothetical protein
LESEKHSQFCRSLVGHPLLVRFKGDQRCPGLATKSVCQIGERGLDDHNISGGLTMNEVPIMMSRDIHHSSAFAVHGTDSPLSSRSHRSTLRVRIPDRHRVRFRTVRYASARITRSSVRSPTCGTRRDPSACPGCQVNGGIPEWHFVGFACW